MTIIRSSQNRQFDSLGIGSGIGSELCLPAFQLFTEVQTAAALRDCVFTLNP